MIFTFILSFTFLNSVLAKKPIIIEGTFIFKEVVPVQTRWTYTVYGGSKSGMKKISDYRKDGYTCTRSYSGRYKCEKVEKGVLPADHLSKIDNQFEDIFVDFEPYDSYRLLNYYSKDWRFTQVVIVDNVVYEKFIYKGARDPVELTFANDQDNITMDALSRRALEIRVYNNTTNAKSIAKVRLDKLTP